MKTSRFEFSNTATIGFSAKTISLYEYVNPGYNLSLSLSIYSPIMGTSNEVFKRAWSRVLFDLLNQMK